MTIIRLKIKGIPGVYPDQYSDFVTFETALQPIPNVTNESITKDIFYSIHDNVNKLKQAIQRVYASTYKLVGYFDATFNLAIVASSRFVYIVEEGKAEIECFFTTPPKFDAISDSAKYKVTFELTETKQTIINYLSYPEMKFGKNDSDLVKLSFYCTKDLLNSNPDLRSTGFHIYTCLYPKTSSTTPKQKDSIVNGKNELNVTNSQVFETKILRFYLKESDAKILRKIYDKCENYLVIDNAPLGVTHQFTINFLIDGQKSDVLTFKLTLDGTIYNISSISNEMPSAMAARVAAMTFTGWTMQQLGNQVTFYATTKGEKIVTFEEIDVLGNFSLTDEVIGSLDGQKGLQPVSINENNNSDELFIDLYEFDITFFESNLLYNKY